MSSSSSDLSQASTKVNGDKNLQESPKIPEAPPVALSATAHDVLLFLISFRLLNALAVQTFFQPDEYFQALEPAWELAFGPRSGAWITWEWENQLRSAIHPALFAAFYSVLTTFANLCRLPDSLRVELLLAAPKVLQALIAAAGDYYTWKLAENIYGKRSTLSWTALALTAISPWQWFCSTRTFSNCLETTLTIVALYNWPWHWSSTMQNDMTALSAKSDSDTRDVERVAQGLLGELMQQWRSIPLGKSSASSRERNPKVDKHGLRVRDSQASDQVVVDELAQLCYALLLAAFATVLRPTNILIWAVLIFATFFRTSRTEWMVHVPWIDQNALVHFSSWKLVPTPIECWTMIIECGICGSVVLLFSAVADRLFYGLWTFPALNFLYFNVVQSFSSFYGTNNWHYYLSQGYPLLLTTALPFALVAIYQILSDSPRLSVYSDQTIHTLKSLTAISLMVPLFLSIIAHKEVRFIYPLLPALHIIAVQPFHDFFLPTLLHLKSHPKLVPPNDLVKRALLIALFAVNGLIAIYTTTIHNSGLIRVTSHLRQEFTTHYHTTYPDLNMTVGFLMPCHSTPWRSHLQFPPTEVHPGIAGWALTCEPPLNLSSSQRKQYVDEADEFYENPGLWLKKHMLRGPPVPPSARSSYTSTPAAVTNYKKSTKKEWPDYLVFFEQLEPVLNIVMRGSGYKECVGGRFFNTRWHDDWRRTGDVVVWCLDSARQKGPTVTNESPSEDEKQGKKSLTQTEEQQRRRELDWLSGGIRKLKREHPTTVDSKNKVLGGGIGPWGVGVGVDAAAPPTTTTGRKPGFFIHDLLEPAHAHLPDPDHVLGQAQGKGGPARHPTQQQQKPLSDRVHGVVPKPTGEDQQVPKTSWWWQRRDLIASFPNLLSRKIKKEPGWRERILAPFWPRRRDDDGIWT